MAAPEGAGFAPRDHLGASTNAALRKTLNSFRAEPKNASALAGFPADAEEQVLFADNLIKVNRYGSRQQRTLIITTIAVLNFKPKVFTEFKRRIPIAFIEELWLVTGTHDIVLHMWEMSGEYDYHFDAGSAAKRDEIVAALRAAYHELMDASMRVRAMDARASEAGMITKPRVKERTRSLDPGAMNKALESRRSIVTSISSQRAASRRHLGSPSLAAGPMASMLAGAGLGGAGGGSPAAGGGGGSSGDVSPLGLAGSGGSSPALGAAGGAAPAPALGLGGGSGSAGASGMGSAKASFRVAPGSGGAGAAGAATAGTGGASGGGPRASTFVGGGEGSTAMVKAGGGGPSAAQMRHLEAAAQPILAALADAMRVLHDVSAAAADNTALVKIMGTWPEPAALPYSYTLAEALHSANAGDAIFKGVTADPGRAHKLLHASGGGASFPLDAAVRGWCTRSLWKLLTLLRQASLLQEDVRTAGGFEGFVLRGFTVAPASSMGGSSRMLSLAPLVARFEAPVYIALMEILIDNVVKPSDSLAPTSVETFGKLLVRPEQLRLLFRLLPSADWQLKHDVMKDLNVLLVQRPDNFPRILEQGDWMSWLAPLLANLPRKANDRSELMNDYLKYVMNFFIMLLARVFSTPGASGDVDRCLTRFMHQMRMQCGWGDAVVGVVRNLIASLAQKVAGSNDRWQRKYDRPEWENLFKLATVVEDFIFYRPVSEDGGDGMSELLAEQAAGGVPMVLYMSTNMLHPTAQMPVAPATVEGVDRSTPGLHLNISTGEADDLKLAQRVLAIFTSVGLTGDPATDPTVARCTDKKAKDLLVHANGIMKVMREVVAFLEDCNKNRLLGDTTGDAASATGAGARPRSTRDPEAAEKALLENLAKFLEKRQKQQRTGFLSRSATKKGIVQALQTNVMRQRAQQTVRAQVQATLMAKAKMTTVVLEDDEEEEEEPAARAGTTAKRLQGTRAAVDQLAAQTGPAAATAAGAAAAPTRASMAGLLGRAPAASMMRGGATTLAGLSHIPGSGGPAAAGGAGAAGGPVHIGSGDMGAGSVVAAAAAEAVKASMALVDMDNDTAAAGAGGAGAGAGAPTSPAAGAGGAGAAADGAAGGEAAGATEEDQRVADLICDRCTQPLLDDDGVMALGCNFHLNCFCCAECDVPFRDAPYYERKGKAYCRADYLRLFGKTVCAGCMEPLRRGQRALEAGSRVYHPEHFCCEGCGDVFPEDAQYYEREGAPYCAKCNLKLFGTCAGCDQQISADRPAVSAMNRNWHLACIKCSACGGGFEDGVFYTSEDESGVMHAYCERDYLEMHAPRCRGCTDIIKDAGLHACGSSWHSHCFVCTVCKEAFPEANYFEVDGRPYCSSDYYKNFGTKCAGCADYITDEVVNALGQQWHVGHFNCARCAKPFADFEYYEKDGKAYDEPCYCELFCPVCPVCSCYIVEDGAVALGTVYHPWCLRCSHCGDQLTSVVHQSEDGKLYCDQDFMALVAYTCKKCGGVIEGDSVSVLEQHWHPHCFTCTMAGCEVDLSGEEAAGGLREIDGELYCAQHHADLKNEKCARCGRGIIVGQGLTVLKQNWHPACLACHTCERAMTTADRFYPRDGKPTCEECFLASAHKCAGCGKGIAGKFLNVLGRKYHQEGCLNCAACGNALSTQSGLYQRKGFPVCREHATKADLAPEFEARFAESEARAAAALAASPAPAPAPAPAAGAGGAAP